jgi:superkiller protein 3
MKTKVWYIILCVLALFSASACDQKKTIEREYAYTGDETDNQQTAQTIAATEMREILLRDAGEYLYPELRQTHSEQAKRVEAVTSGVVGMEVIDQQWDSVSGRYYILARMVVEPDKVNQKITKVLGDKYKTAELEESRRRTNEAKAKAQQLRIEVQRNPTPAAKEAYKKEVTKLAVEEYFVKGFNAQESGYYDMAIEQYQKAIELTPEDAKVYIKMGTAFATKEDYEQAIIYFNKALAIYPYSSYAYNNLGNAYAALKNYAQAIYCYQKAIEIDPNEAYAYNNMGNAYSAQEHFVEAIEFYTTAITLFPNFAGAYSNMGTTYADLKNFKQAIDCYQKAISLDPYLADAQNNMGYAYYEMRNYAQAINCYKKALTIDPKFAEAYNNLGIAYGAQGNNSQRTDYSIKAARLGDADARAWLIANGYRW